MDRGKERLFISANIAIPVIAGAVIYYLFCPNVIFVRALDCVFLKMAEIRNICSVNIPAVSFFRNYFLDMLWSYALVFTVFIFLKENGNSLKNTFFITATYAAALEFVQAIPGVSGTFDWLDILAEFLSEVIAIIFIKMHMRRKFR
ncbi:MAG: hypothetical protein ACI4E1_07940 [Lachnospira sp.]